MQLLPNLGITSKLDHSIFLDIYSQLLKTQFYITNFFKKIIIKIVDILFYINKINLFKIKIIIVVHCITIKIL